MGINISRITPSGVVRGDVITVEGTGLTMGWIGIEETPGDIKPLSNIKVRTSFKTIGETPESLSIGLKPVRLVGPGNTILDTEYIYIGKRETDFILGGVLGSKKIEDADCVIGGSVSTKSRGWFGYPMPVRFLEIDNVWVGNTSPFSLGVDGGVDPRKIDYLYLKPQQAQTVFVGEYIQFRCYAGGEQFAYDKDVTKEVIWNSTNPYVGKVSKLGLFKAIRNGITVISARMYLPYRGFVRASKAIKVK
ncbi:MAG: hypothetical protein DRZ76_01380 [Candidatus Nealsonbacteria bacterium]|nr:MAG: hypothetical protein DRZ76_01380 [Candidatus Nealsonbacteria bacterium]